MACSLETRVPYLDHELVNYAFAFSAGEIFEKGLNKSHLRRAAEKIQPDYVKTMKTKQQRPGNSKRIIFNVLYEDAITSISSCDQFFSPNAANEFKIDREKGENSNFWFRAYLVTRWHKIYFS